MKQIPATLRGCAYWANVDDEDYEFLRPFNWTASVRRTVIYARTNVETNIGFNCVEMHRMIIGDAKEIWRIPEGMVPWEHHLENGKTLYLFPEKYRRFREMTVDHTDGNGLNNTRANPRHLSRRDQVKNRFH